MSKVKVSLANGSVLEKPLVTCFQGGQGNYIILDNETNGSMGMPIVCISKYNNERAEKIVDPNEWAAVKESIKSIIAGTKLNYLNVADTIQANEDFYTQLTIPVEGFDVIKKAYAPETGGTSAPTAQPLESLDAVPTVPTPEIPSLEPIAPVIPEAPIMDVQTIANPAPIDLATPASTNNIPEANPLEPVAPMATPVPNEPISSMNLNGQADIAAIKENFMKSCETMFDALIKQFNNK